MFKDDLANAKLVYINEHGIKMQNFGYYIR